MLERQFEYIRGITDFSPEIAIVLGSGLGGFADEIDPAASVSYADIPDFPVSTAPTHEGRFIFGTLGEARIAVMQGRVHLYEGYTPQEVVSPIRLLRMTGAKTIILTNACGGIGKHLKPGDLLLIEDHISSFVPSPLAGKNDDNIGVRFPDMSKVYSVRLKKAANAAALRNKIELKHGVYIQLPGPAFETKAEIKMCAALGADAVGMSTAIEAQAAKHCGFEVCGISCVTNYACGVSNRPITSEEVSETAALAAEKFKSLLTALTENIHYGKY